MNKFEFFNMISNELISAGVFKERCREIQNWEKTIVRHREVGLENDHPEVARVHSRREITEGFLAKMREYPEMIFRDFYDNSKFRGVIEKYISRIESFQETYTNLATRDSVTSLVDYAVIVLSDEDIRFPIREDDLIE